MENDFDLESDDDRMAIIRKGLTVLKKKEEEIDFVFIDLEKIPYDQQNPENFVKESLNTAINNSLSTIKLHTQKLEPVYQTLISKKDILFDIFLHLFWVTHFRMNRPSEVDIINRHISEVSKIWATFLYPLYCDFKNITVDKTPGLIVFVMPYLATQVLQETFILLSEGNPKTAKKDFRMELCRMQVEIFSNNPLLDSLMQERLSTFFSKPPFTDIPDKILNPPDVKKDASVLIPKEDVNSLIEIDRRIKPISKKFKTANLSPLVSKATKQDNMPYSCNVSMIIQVPKNGVADWTTNLPSLLPDPKTAENAVASVDRYNPNNETRSLIHRSRRPNILLDYQKRRDDFIIKSNMHDERMFNFQRDLELNIAKTQVCEPKTLTEFVKDLQKLHRENKRDETPDFVEDEAKLIKLAREKVQNDYTMISTVQPRVKVKTLTPFQKKHQKKYINSKIAILPIKEPLRLSQEKEMIDKALIDFKIKHDDLFLGLV